MGRDVCRVQVGRAARHLHEKRQDRRPGARPARLLPDLARELHLGRPPVRHALRQLCGSAVLQQGHAEGRRLRRPPCDLGRAGESLWPQADRQGQGRVRLRPAIGARRDADGRRLRPLPVALGRALPRSVRQENPCQRARRAGRHGVPPSPVAHHAARHRVRRPFAGGAGAGAGPGGDDHGMVGVLLDADPVPDRRRPRRGPRTQGPEWRLCRVRRLRL